MKVTVRQKEQDPEQPYKPLADDAYTGHDERVPS